MGTSRETSAVAVVINPSKFADATAARAIVEHGASRAGYEPSLWYETSADDSGAAAAQAAAHSGAAVVCAMGGDGTVRTVAAALRGTSTPFAILPSGTGNLLARNLGLPLGSLTEAVEVALLGQTRAIDVGTASFDDGPERLFLVMGGVGVDAVLMDKTDEALKNKVGWGAYAAFLPPALLSSGFTSTITIDGRRQKPRRSLMVLACNCSAVVGSISLATGAVLDDGDLELVVLRRRFGLLFDVATRNRNRVAALNQWPGRTFEFELDRPVLAELDGDPVGLTTRGRFGVDPGSLLVRVPVPTPRSAALESAGA